MVFGKLICRLFNSHKWVRLETAREEAYQCRRCGKRFFGKPGDPDLTPFAGGNPGF
jgi:DNA-directed RNA polymerase subunit RPC12/RpoP